MGVPAFFRWLSEKYPKVLTPVHEVPPETTASSSGYAAAASACENLYIDMNGVIHPCAHPEDRAAPSSEAEVFEDVMLYVDRLVAATRPRRLVYLAIDGVAPRAKMNQQRSRRWKAAKEAAEQRALEAEARAEVTGESAPGSSSAAKVGSAEWDTNVITPGTGFMRRLSEAVRRGVAARLERGAWGEASAVVSDASVPGEGEHKIMAFVRGLRGEAGYDPNTRHVLHGLDADLIMLALATHEPRFAILREEVLFGRAAKKYEESAKVEREAHAKLLAGAGRAHKSWIYTKPLQLLEIATLREYLAVEFASVGRVGGAALDLENAIDDFVFLCFFCGNDFIPHLPSLDIREGALDLLLNVYKAALPALGGYVTSQGGRIDLAKLAPLLRRIGAVEDEIFKRRRKFEDEERARRRAQHHHHHQAEEEEEENIVVSGVRTEAELARSIERRVARKRSKRLDDCAASFVDLVRLGEAGWKQRYYGSRFVRRDVEAGGGLQALATEYLKGLDWVLRYYYAGCPSWGWYFPFHYAPFASDLADLVDAYLAREAPTSTFIDQTLAADLQLGAPFTPLQQLLAVLPAASAHALPAKCRLLMLDPASPIADFYSDDVDVDPNGKAMPWLHVVLLPFVDADRLVEALDAVGLDPDDAALGAELSDALLYARTDSHLAAALLNGAATRPILTGDCLVDPPGATLLTATLKPPPTRPHLSVLLPGAAPPPPALNDRHDLLPRPAPRIGRRGAPQVAELAADQAAAPRGLNLPALHALAPAPKRTWGSLEPQAPLKRPRLLSQQPPRHSFAHPAPSTPLTPTTYATPYNAARTYPLPRHHSPPAAPYYNAQDNTASANSLRAQLALALRKRHQQNSSQR